MWIPCVEGKEYAVQCVEGKVCVDTVPRGEGVIEYRALEGKVCVDTVRRGEGVCGYRA